MKILLITLLVLLTFSGCAVTANSTSPENLRVIAKLTCDVVYDGKLKQITMECKK